MWDGDEKLSMTATVMARHEQRSSGARIVDVIVVFKDS